MILLAAVFSLRNLIKFFNLLIANRTNYVTIVHQKF